MFIAKIKRAFRVNRNREVQILEVFVMVIAYIIIVL